MLQGNCIRSHIRFLLRSPTGSNHCNSRPPRSVQKRSPKWSSLLLLPLLWNFSDFDYRLCRLFNMQVGSTSTLYNVINSRKNRPSLNPQIVLPSLAGGFMFGFAMTITIICTESLSQAITGPITGTSLIPNLLKSTFIAMVPSCVGTIWSVFYFKEIEVSSIMYTHNLYL